MRKLHFSSTSRRGAVLVAVASMVLANTAAFGFEQNSTPKPAAKKSGTTAKKVVKPKPKPTPTKEILASATNYLSRFMASHPDCGQLWKDKTHDYGGVPSTSTSDIEAICYSSKIWINGHGYNRFGVTVYSKQDLASLIKGTPNCTSYRGISRIMYNSEAMFRVETNNGDINWLNTASEIIEREFGTPHCSW